MLTRALNIFALAALLALPLYGARAHAWHRRPAARTDAEHRADLARLNMLPHDEFLVSGQGAPRPQLSDCDRDLPLFTKLLASKGLSPIENVTCVPVAGNADSYAPSFRALASEPLQTTTVWGGRFNSLSFCEIESGQMSVDLGGKHAVLEASCDHEAGGLDNSSGDVYRPAVVVLDKTASGLAEPRRYSAIEVLVEDASAVTKRKLGGATDPSVAE